MGIGNSTPYVVILPTRHTTDMDQKEHIFTQRDRDFIAACRRFIAASGKQPLTAMQLASAAAASPAPSYYITYDYAMRKLNDPSDENTPAAQRMADIRQRVEHLMQSRGLERRHALSLVLAGTSPKGFFLGESTAVRLFHRLRRKPHLRRPLNPLDPLTTLNQ